MANWTREEVFAFLGEEPRIGRLATVTPDGDPHVVPVWFRVDGERVLVHTLGSYQKTRNLRHRGRFALTVDTETWPYKGVTLRGSAHITEPDHHPFVEEVTVAYLGEDARPMARHMADLPGEHVILSLEPEVWHSFDYSKN